MKLSKKNTLPKQLKHWFKLAGLKNRAISTRGKRCRYSVYYTVTGHGFLWRVDCGMLYRSCEIKDFDRWANSQSFEHKLGSCQKDFLVDISFLILK